MLGDVGTEDRTERSADGDETIKPFTLLNREQVGHERPEDGGIKQIENADPNKETATNPHLLRCGTASHRNEKEHKDGNEKSIGERNEFSPRHPRHSRSEGGVSD